MISNLYCASVYVNDQEKALDFYTKTLGWEVVDDTKMGDGRWLVVKPKGAETGVAILGPGWISPEDGSSASVGGHTGISMVTPDVQAFYDELGAKGVSFQGPPEEMPWGGKAVHMSDPDGNIYFIAGA